MQVTVTDVIPTALMMAGQQLWQQHWFDFMVQWTSNDVL
jgi:hypothetical protein